MAKPAFIYAFDNLGPEKFTELCGLLLGSRHKGFLLGGVGADGGIDGEVDTFFGEWHTETVSPILGELIQPEQLVIFQFKHKVVGRIGGQIKARESLQEVHTCKKSRTCDLHRTLIQKRCPDVYVLVTNVEVNAPFRATFIQHCRKENPDIKLYQIIGLDELEGWITMVPELRHLYFPTIFGSPRFDLRLKLDNAWPTKVHLPYTEQDPQFILKDVLRVSVLNVGLVPSYIHSIQFVTIVDGKLQTFSCRFDDVAGSNAGYISSRFGEVLHPGQKQVFFFSFSNITKAMRKLGHNAFPVEAQVHDEIGNVYSENFSEEMRNDLQTYIG